MSTIVIFAVGVVVGVVYEKQLRAWKLRASKAANAAKQAFNS